MSDVRSFLTEPELAICKLLNAKWISRDAVPEGYEEYDWSRDVDLWSERPEVDDGFFLSKSGDLDSCLASISAEFFPSVEPGDCVEVVYVE